MSENTTDNINHILHCIVNYTGIFLNVLLMLLIILNTPKALRSYAVLLFNFAITDFMACCSALFVMQRIIPTGWSLFYISYGYCTNISEMACYVGYAFMLHYYAHTLISMPISFFYRYYILIKTAPKPRTCVIVCVLAYIPSLFQAVTFITASTKDIDAVRGKLHEMFPAYNLTGAVVTGHLDIRNIWTIYTILYMTLPCGPIYLLILFLRRRVYSCLDLAEMSAATKKTHKLLMKALTFQACLPALFTIAVTCYAIEQLNFLHHPILEHTVFQSVGLLPMASPLVSLYFVGPYKRAIVGAIAAITGNKSVEPTSKFASTIGERRSNSFKAGRTF